MLDDESNLHNYINWTSTVTTIKDGQLYYKVDGKMG